ncbi:MAG: hypothetical protein FWH26_07380 [Oscillospiraceae bacterium]|nr:hypothetical protein [Oscillospiraceae bacterium]
MKNTQRTLSQNINYPGVSPDRKAAMQQEHQPKGTAAFPSPSKGANEKVPFPVQYEIWKIVQAQPEMPNSVQCFILEAVGKDTQRIIYIKDVDTPPITFTVNMPVPFSQELGYAVTCDVFLLHDGHSSKLFLEKELAEWMSC